MRAEDRERLLADLREDEGRKPRMYTDPVGVSSIGYGHNLQDGPPLSQRAMDQILDDDLADAETRCERIPEYRTLDDVRKTVLLNMAFNLGLGGFRFPLMFEALRRRDYETAAREMRDSKWARQVGARAERLAEMMRTGRWP